jgi:hypothetical protein
MEACLVVGLKEALQGILQIGDAVMADEGFPPCPEFVEHCFAFAHERIPAIGHCQARSPGIDRIGASEDITAVFQKRDCLRGGLLGDRGAPPHFGDRFGSCRDSAQREIVGGSDTGVPTRGKSNGRLFGQETEPAEQQQREVGTASRHGSIVPTPTTSTTRLFISVEYDNLVVFVPMTLAGRRP